MLSGTVATKADWGLHTVLCCLCSVVFDDHLHTLLLDTHKINLNYHKFIKVDMINSMAVLLMVCNTIPLNYSFYGRPRVPMVTVHTGGIVTWVLQDNFMSCLVTSWWWLQNLLGVANICGFYNRKHFITVSYWGKP